MRVLATAFHAVFCMTGIISLYTQIEDEDPTIRRDLLPI